MFVKYKHSKPRIAKGGRKDDKIYEILKEVSPLWDHAYRSTSPDGDFLVVPTLAQPFIQVMKDEQGKEIERYCPPLSLLIYRDKNNEQQARYLVIYPDKNTQMDYVDLTSFSGRLVYYDLEGQVVATKVYENGKRFSEASDFNKSGRIGAFCKLKFNCRYSGYDSNSSQAVVYGRWEIAETQCATTFQDNVTLRYYHLDESTPIYVCEYDAPDQNPQPYPSSGGGGGTTGPNSLNLALANKPFGLYEPNMPPCSTFAAWLDLARFKVSGNAKQRVMDLSHDDNINFGLVNGVSPNTTYIADVLDIDDAYSAVVNMDYFEVTVNKLPYLYGHQVTAPELLNYIRLNFMQDIGGLSFMPYSYNGIDDTNIPFTKADATWTEWQNQVLTLVKNFQGSATIRPKIIYRPDWKRVKDVRDRVKPISTLSNDC
ncbi:hypothetical protein [Siphonobacter sp. SORGH_AS_0500]|uniref:hypothetical protein n=1 Tax=Siphonobacter sp. SORGH_AS_0500 TaxID=1864824 RepID=UPI00285E1617|nr:hypothetical protein [Siphonobacter sp. SORGH_AS_0500]MDR6197663.1 hypothetical protein [Siphonobacter sp. SORGH_AS_0500]